MSKAKSQFESNESKEGWWCKIVGHDMITVVRRNAIETDGTKSVESVHRCLRCSLVIEEAWGGDA